MRVGTLPPVCSATTEAVSPPRNRAWVALALVVAVAVLLRGVAAFHAWWFNYDGISYLEAARAIRDGTLGEAWNVRMLHPVYPALVAAVSLVCADMVVAARLVALVGSVATVAVVSFWWIRHRPAREAIFLAVLLCLHPGLILFGSEILTEMITLPLLWCAGLLAVRAARSSRVLDVAILGLVLGLLTWVKSTSVFFVPGAALVAGLPLLRARQWRRVGAAALVFAIVFGLTAYAPRVVEKVLTGTNVDLIGHENNATDWYVLGLTPEQAAEHSRAALTFEKWGVNLWRTMTTYVPRQLHPWWLALPIALWGTFRLLRARDSAGTLIRALACIIGVEWFFRFFFLIHDRYLMPSVLVFLPGLAVGCEALLGLGQRIRFGRMAAWSVTILVPAAWVYTFARTHAPEPPVNVYRLAGLALKSSDKPPVRLLSLNPEIAWYAGAQRQRLGPRTADDVVATFLASDCDALVIGPTERRAWTGTSETAGLPVGASWRGLNVVAQMDQVTILTR